MSAGNEGARGVELTEAERAALYEGGLHRDAVTAVRMGIYERGFARDYCCQSLLATFAAVESIVADRACTCPWLDPTYWTTHYGAVEPGSAQEYDPTCPVHGALRDRAEQAEAALSDARQREERVRDALLQGGQTAQIRWRAALIALDAGRRTVSHAEEPDHPVYVRDTAEATLKRVRALMAAADADMAESNKQVERETGRASTMVAFVLTSDLAQALNGGDDA